MTDRLAEIRARLEAATPGPWDVRGGDAIYGRDSTSAFAQRVATIERHRGNAREEATAEFIANAPSDIAYLLARVQRLERVAKAAQALESNYNNEAVNYSLGRRTSNEILAALRAALEDSEP